MITTTQGHYLVWLSIAWSTVICPTSRLITIDNTTNKAIHIIYYQTREGFEGSHHRKKFQGIWNANKARQIHIACASALSIKHPDIQRPVTFNVHSRAHHITISMQWPNRLNATDDVGNSDTIWNTLPYLHVHQAQHTPVHMVTHNITNDPAHSCDNAD